MSLRSAITTDNARVDIRANGFWTGAQDAYFDVRLIHPNAPSNAGSISSAFKKHEDAKKELTVNASEFTINSPLQLFVPLFCVYEEADLQLLVTIQFVTTLTSP